MALIEFYVPLRHAHLAAVSISLVLFAARGSGVLAGHQWPMHRGVRWTSIVIDTVLLVCGVALWAALGLNPVRDSWLGIKLALLLLYIGLGSFALKRAKSHRAKAAFFAAATLCAATMLSVAWTRHPAGLWRGLQTPFT
jgi:uncharacterized membrane protein SirB2